MGKVFKKHPFAFILSAVVIVGLFMILLGPSNSSTELSNTVPTDRERMTFGEFTEGEHFFVLSAPIEGYAETPEIEVEEFFWYGCPHCYSFEPHINAWAEKQPSHVSFDRIHPAFGANWLPHAKAFYALKEIDKEDTYHSEVMDAIQHNQSAYDSGNEIARLLNEEDKEAFLNAYNSVDSQVDEANMKAKRSGIEGVPSLIIDGKYVTSPAYVGSNERVITLLDKLKRAEQ